MLALVLNDVEGLGTVRDHMAHPALDVQVPTLRDPRDDVERVHVLDERAQGVLGHGLVEQHLVGLRVHHVRAVERDEQAVVVLQVELGGEGAQPLNRTARRQNQADAQALRRQQGLARTGVMTFLSFVSVPSISSAIAWTSHGACPFSSLRSWDYPYPPHAICRRELRLSLGAKADAPPGSSAPV